MSLLESQNVSFLFVKINGLFHPGFEGGGDFLHRVNHGDYLDIKSLSKEPSYFRDVSYLRLCNQVLEFGEVCLESVIFSSGNLF